MRQLKALAIVIALVFVAPALDYALGGVGEVHGVEAEQVGIDLSALSQTGDANSVLDGIEVMANPRGLPPTWFEEEIGVLPGAYDVRASGPVVGYSVQQECDEAVRLLKTHMINHGWTCVSLGSVEGATFVKDSGACTWALATCTQVGSTTSVVIRCNAG